MEQLLDVVQDWESYANRDNSLASFRDEIIALIIGWRKLELSAWNRLLDQEVMSYDAENAAWWFRLYELLIVGTESAIETGGSEIDLKFKQHLDSALPLIMEYISATSCGHFGSRLRLLGSFADYIDVTKLRPSAATAELWRHVMHLLRNVEASYGQYVEITQQTINNQRAPLEKAVRDFVKLASWKDVNVNAMQASARKSHAQLYKTIRKFRDVLRQPVTSFLSIPLPTLPAWENSSVIQGLTVLDAPLAIGRPAEIDTPTFLADANRTVSKYQRIMSIDDQPTSSACETVDDLATDIIETAEALVKETPAHLTEENKKNVKNLQTRKRKAFSDLLKELRRLGFSAKVRADQLANQSSAANILKLCPLEQDDASELSARDLLKRVEQYHHRLDFALPAMRHAMNDHSADIVTYDLQRAHGFAESAFAEALGSRKE
jgi:midasin